MYRQGPRAVITAKTRQELPLPAFQSRIEVLLRLLFCLLALAVLLGVQTTASQIPAAAQAGPGFDAKAATDAYLATYQPEKKARSDAYFEGGYWLILWDFLYASAISILLLATGLSARMRDAAERTYEA